MARLLGHLIAGAVGGGAEQHIKNIEDKQSAAAAELKAARAENLKRIEQAGANLRNQNTIDAANKRNEATIAAANKRNTDNIAGRENVANINQAGKTVKPPTAGAINEMHRTLKANAEAAGYKVKTDKKGRVTSIKGIPLDAEGNPPQSVIDMMSPFESFRGKERKDWNMPVLNDTHGKTISFGIGGVKSPSAVSAGTTATDTGTPTAKSTTSKPEVLEPKKATTKITEKVVESTIADIKKAQAAGNFKAYMTKLAKDNPALYKHIKELSKKKRTATKPLTMQTGDKGLLPGVNNPTVKYE